MAQDGKKHIPYSDDGKLCFDWDVNIVKPLLKSNYKIPDMWPLFKALADVPTMVSEALSRISCHPHVSQICKN